MQSNKKHKTESKPKAVLINSLTRDTVSLTTLIDYLGKNEELTILTPIFLMDSNIPKDLNKNIKYLFKEAETDIENKSKKPQKKDFEIDASKNQHFDAKNTVSLKSFNKLLKSRQILFWDTVDYLEDELKNYEILLIMVSNEAFVHERIFLEFAKKHKIPSLHLNHGLALWQTSSAYRTGNCDYYSVGSLEDKYALLYQAETVNPDYKYREVGMTSMDKYYLLKSNRKKFFPKNLPKDKKIISFFTTFDNTTYIRHIEKDAYQRSLEIALKTCESLHKDPNTFFVLKDRPTNFKFAKEKFEILMNKYPKIDQDRIIYVFDFPEPYVLASEIVISISSTIGIEAVLAGALAININFNAPDFSAKSHIPNLDESEDIGSFALDLLKDKNKLNMLKQLQKNPYLIGEIDDGLSSLRTAKYISELIGFKEASANIKTDIKNIHKWQAKNPKPKLSELLNLENPHSKYWKTINSLIKYDQRFNISDEYKKWQQKQIATELDGELMAQRLVNSWRTMPIFHLIYIVDASLFDALSKSLAALEHQLYKNFTISVISTDAIPSQDLLELNNFRWVKTDKPFATVNQLIKDISADWVILPIAGDELNFDALFYFGEYINLFPDWLAIYTDEDTIFTSDTEEKRPTENMINEQNNKIEKAQQAPGDIKTTSAIDDYYKNLQAKLPIFKPDFNLELYRSTDYIGPTVAIKTDLVKALGGFSDLPYSQSSQMLFVLAEQMSAPAIGHIAKILNHKGNFSQNLTKNNKNINQINSLIRQEHLKRCGFKDTEFSLTKGLKPNTYRSLFKFKQEPKVAILIDIYPSVKNRFVACLLSLNMQNYQNFEVFLLLPENLGERSINLLNKSIELLQKKTKVNVLKSPPKNKKDTLNQLIEAADEFENWIFLQSDVELMQDNWIEEMINHSIKSEVAMVGPRIINTNGQIISAGQVLGFNGDFDDIYKDFHLEQDLELLPKLWCDQNYSALSQLALLVKKSAFYQAGGFAQEFSDYHLFADLGIRMQLAGKRLHWTPYATCVCYEESQNYLTNRYSQKDFWYQKWSHLLPQDPSHNENLSLQESGNQITKVPQSWSKYFMQLPRILSYTLYSKQSSIQDTDSLTVILNYLFVQEKILFDTTSLEMEVYEQNRINPIEAMRINPDIIIFIGIPFYDSMQKDVSLIKTHFNKKLVAVVNSEEDVLSWSNNFKHIDLWILMNEKLAELKLFPKNANFIKIDTKALEEKNLETNKGDKKENQLIEKTTQNLLDTLIKTLNL